VYFKPVRGSGGNRIVRIERMRKHGCRLRGRVQLKSANSLDYLHSRLASFAGKKLFILQKGIDLAATKGQPFDLRVMVQKPKSGGWTTTAVFAKIGKRGKVATNYNQGGKLAYLRETLKGSGYSDKRVAETRAKLYRLGETAGKCFDKHGGGFRELGLDVAIDKSGRYWILETNTRPQFYPLRQMRNKRLYRHIVNYAKQYGRTR